MSLQTICQDFLEFQDVLKKMRDMDDKIIYALNTSLPTESFKGQVNGESTCRSLYDQLTAGHRDRENRIKQCILFSTENINKLRNDKETGQDNLRVDKTIKTEQRKLRVLEAELYVEDIVKERSYKAFNERCRTYFKTGKLS